jgi:hypothetical protein
MKKPSQRMTTLVASALGALVLAFLPARSYAHRHHHDSDDWNSNAWQGIQHEREELDQARAAQRQDWKNLQHEQREMDQALRAEDWDEYQHEQREAEQAANAVRRDQAQIEHEQRELRQQQRALRHHRHDWDED